jgi:DNA-binding NarL/FixJ family response regulator
VALLLGPGLTNAQIGEKLFISPKTVEHHVSNILGKLALRSRFEVAAINTALPR